jgi:hypothetical protein
MPLTEEQIGQLKLRSEVRRRSQERLRQRGQVAEVPRGTEVDGNGKGFLSGLKGFARVDIPRMAGGLSQYLATVDEVLQLKKAERESNPELYTAGVEIGRVPPEPKIDTSQLIENLQNNRLYQTGKQMLESSERTRLEHPELESTPVTLSNFYKPSVITEQLARNLPQAGAAALIPIVTGALTKSPMAGMVAGGALVYGMEAGSAYSDAIDAGLDPETASEIAHRTGLVNAVVEQTSVMPLLKTLGLGKAASKELTGKITKELIKRGAIGTIGKSTAEQFVTEGMEEVVQELNGIVQLEQHLPTDKRSKPKDIVNRLFQAFYGGATAGGAIGVSAGVVSTGARAVGERAERRTLREQYEAGKQAREKIAEEERAVEPEKKWVETPEWRVEEKVSKEEAKVEPAKVEKVKPKAVEVEPPEPAGAPAVAEVKAEPVAEAGKQVKDFPFASDWMRYEYLRKPVEKIEADDLTPAKQAVLTQDSDFVHVKETPNYLVLTEEWTQESKQGLRDKYGKSDSETIVNNLNPRFKNIADKLGVDFVSHEVVGKNSVVVFKKREAAVGVVSDKTQAFKPTLGQPPIPEAAKPVEVEAEPIAEAKPVEAGKEAKTIFADYEHLKGQSYRSQKQKDAVNSQLPPNVKFVLSADHKVASFYTETLLAEKDGYRLVREEHEGGNVRETMEFPDGDTVGMMRDKHGKMHEEFTGDYSTLKEKGLVSEAPDGTLVVNMKEIHEFFKSKLPSNVKLLTGEPVEVKPEYMTDIINAKSMKINAIISEPMVQNALKYIDIKRIKIYDGEEISVKHGIDNNNPSLLNINAHAPVEYIRGYIIDSIKEKLYHNVPDNIFAEWKDFNIKKRYHELTKDKGLKGLKGFLEDEELNYVLNDQTLKEGLIDGMLNNTKDLKTRSFWADDVNEFFAGRKEPLMLTAKPVEVKPKAKEVERAGGEVVPEISGDKIADEARRQGIPDEMIESVRDGVMDLSGNEANIGASLSDLVYQAHEELAKIERVAARVKETKPAEEVAIRQQVQEADIESKIPVNHVDNVTENVQAKIESEPDIPVEIHIQEAIGEDATGLRLINPKEVNIDLQRFQNRVDPFSKETYDKIMTEGWNLNINKVDPVIAWQDPANKAWYLLSGHSRLKAAQDLGVDKIYALDSGKISESEAIKIAENSNRRGTPETVLEDIRLYNKLVERKASKEEIHASLRGRENRIRDFAGLNPKGEFMDLLNQEARGMDVTAYPYLLARAATFGKLRLKYPDQLTDAHEQQFFKWLYVAEKDSKETAGGRFNRMRREDIEEMIEGQVTSKSWKPSMALRLQRGKPKDMAHLRDRKDLGPAFEQLDIARLEREIAVIANDNARIESLDARIKVIKEKIENVAKNQVDMFGEEAKIDDIFFIDASEFEMSKKRLVERLVNEEGALKWEDVKGDKMLFNDLVTVGKGYINAGARSVKEFTEKLVAEFGEKFRQIAGDLYNHVMTTFPPRREATEQMTLDGMFLTREQAARTETAGVEERKVEVPVVEKKGIPKTIKIEGKDWDVDESNFKPVVDKARRGKGVKLPEEDFVVGRVTSGKKGTNETFVVLNRETGKMVAHGGRKTVAINRFNSWMKGYKEEVAKPRRTRQEWNRKLEAERGAPDGLARASQTITFWKPKREETAGVIEITEQKGGAAEAALTEQAGKKKAGRYWYQAMWGDEAAKHPGMDPDKYNLIRNESGRGGSYLVESFDTYGEMMDYVKANKIPQGWEIQYQKEQTANKDGVKKATAAVKDISQRHGGPTMVRELSEGDIEKLNDGFNEIREEISYRTGFGDAEESMNADRLVDEAGLGAVFELDPGGEGGHIRIGGEIATPNDSWFLANRLTRGLKYALAQGKYKFPIITDPKTGKKQPVMEWVEDMWSHLAGIEKFCKYQKDDANKRWEPLVYRKIISKYLSNQTGLAEDNGHIKVAANPKAYAATRIKALQDGKKISAKEARQMFIEADAYAKERIRWFSNKYFENNNVRELIEKKGLGVDDIAGAMYEKGFRVDDETVNRMVVAPGAKPTVEDHVEAIADEIRLWIEGAKYPESKVQAQLAEVLGAKKEELYPKFEAGWLAGKLGINVDDPYIQFATKFRNLREELTKILVTNPQIPAEARQAIWDNVGYVKRMYHADLLKQSFKIDPGKAELARQEMGKHLQHNLAMFVNRITRMPKAWKIDMLKYATSGSQEILDKYGKNVRFINEARVARDHYMAVERLATWDLKTDMLGELTGEVSYKEQIKMLSIASTDMLNHYLSRKRTGGKAGGEVVVHGMPVRHMMKKFLDSPVLRDVYGEVLNPVDRSIFTVEAQMHLLVNATFLNKIWQNNEGVLWSNDSIPRKGLTHQLGNNPYKLGMMAGKYVSRELHELMTSKNIGPGFKWWYRILGLSRTGKLMTPGTIERNFLTSYTGMALLSGDAVDPRYWVEHHKAFMTMVRAKAGHKQSQDRMVKWAQAGLLGRNLQSMSVDAFNAALGTDAFTRLISTAQLKGKTGGEMVDWALDKFREGYNLCDIPAKVAAWELQVKLNLKTMDQSAAEKAATEYVRQHYQNAQRAARMAGIISKAGVDDFVSFKYDAARIWYNGAENVVKQVKKGGIGAVKSLLGFTLANSILAMSLQKTTAFTYNILVKGIRKLIDDDDEEGKAFDGLMETEQMNATKDVSPFWIKKGFLLGWYRKDGSASVVVMDYLLFYPAMTTVAAILQGRSPKYVLKSTLKDLFGTGMVPEAAFRAYTGQGIEGFRKETKGLKDLGEQPTVGEAGGIALNRGLELVNDAFNPLGRLGLQAWRYIASKVKEKSGSNLNEAQSSKMIFQNTFYPVRIYNVPADRNIKREMWELKHDRDLIHQDIKNSMDLLKKLKGVPLLREQKRLERSQVRMDMCMARVIDKVKSCRTAFPKVDKDGVVEDLVKDTWGKERGWYLYDGMTDAAIRYEREPKRFKGE